MISIAALKAAGLSADQIVRVLETAESERLTKRREQWRVNSRNYRLRHQNHNDADDIDDVSKKPKQKQSSRHRVINDVMTNAAYIEDNLSSSSTQSKKERKKVSIPDFWLPNDAGLALAKEQGWDDHKIKLEIHRFQDHAQANNRRQADWNAAWRNWVTSPYQKPERKNGHAGHSLMEALDAAIDRAGSEDFGRPNPPRDVTPRRGDTGQAPLALVAARKPA